ncbi:hypothetical protein KDA01_19320, partial [Proteus mirabilis]
MYEIENDQWIKNKKNKKRISLKINLKSISLQSDILKKIKIKNKKSNNEISLTNYINKNKLLSCVFTNPNYSYWYANCFEDKKLLNNLDQFTKFLCNDYNFDSVDSEKEKPSMKSYPSYLTEFPKKSLFYKIEEYFNKDDSIVICDDMGDEWADHIIMDTNSNPPSLIFIHEKFTKKETLGASAFHEVISQALKNIGRLHESESSYKEKYDKKWKNNYENTKIKRIKNGKNWSEIKNSLKKINSSPDAIRKIIIAAPFFKKSTLQDEFNKFKEEPSYKLKPYHIQLIWLLSTFI